MRMRVDKHVSGFAGVYDRGLGRGYTKEQGVGGVETTTS